MSLLELFCAVDENVNSLMFEIQSELSLHNWYQKCGAASLHGGML